MTQIETLSPGAGTSRISPNSLNALRTELDELPARIDAAIAAHDVDGAARMEGRRAVLPRIIDVMEADAAQVRADIEAAEMAIEPLKTALDVAGENSRQFKEEMRAMQKRGEQLDNERAGAVSRFSHAQIKVDTLRRKLNQIANG